MGLRIQFEFNSTPWFLTLSETIFRLSGPFQLRVWKRLFFVCLLVLFALLVGSVVERLKHWTDDQHGLGSKPTCAILLCPWERHFTALSPAWWSWQAVLNYSNISTKLLADSNILASPEAGPGNCLPYIRVVQLLHSCGPLFE